MSVTITNEETCQRIEELAELMGASTDDAVATALQHALEQERRAQALTRRMLTDGGYSLSEIEAAIGRQLTQKEIDDWMYDEIGLPR